MRRFIQILVPFVVLALMSTNLHAAGVHEATIPNIERPLDVGGPMRGTQGWDDFCQRFPKECAVDISEPAQIVLTQKIWRLIMITNYAVNRNIRAISDNDHWGVLDRWDFAEDGKGDCEDIQIVKRRALAAAGLPRRAMRMTVVVDELGDGHAVLTIRTDRGDLMLDNRTHLVLPWQKTGYQMIKMESQTSTGWVRISPETVAVATAEP